MNERRKFERVSIPQGAGVQLATPDKHGIGPVRMLGHGGLLVQTRRKFKPGQNLTILLADSGAKIARRLEAEVRYTDNGEVGFAFTRLDAETAIDIGIIIGKFLPRKLERAAGK